MKPTKINWKKKCLEAQGLLKLCRDGNELLNSRALAAEKTLHEMRGRIVEYTEKIVEKEVLPWFVKILFWCLLLLEVGTFGYVRLESSQLQQPILSPYPVQVTWARDDTIYQLLACQKHDAAAVDAWRTDERELRKPRKEHP